MEEKLDFSLPDKKDKNSALMKLLVSFALAGDEKSESNEKAIKTAK